MAYGAYPTTPPPAKPMMEKTFFFPSTVCGRVRASRCAGGAGVTACAREAGGGWWHGTAERDRRRAGGSAFVRMRALVRRREREGRVSAVRHRGGGGG
eukprot:SAG11_NODE_23918_length_381_cov_0.730496_1_plen_97_part_01